MFVGLSYQEIVSTIQKMEEEYLQNVKNPTPATDVDFYRNGFFALRELKKRIKEEVKKKYERS